MRAGSAPRHRCAQSLRDGEASVLRSARRRHGPSRGRWRSRRHRARVPQQRPVRAGERQAHAAAPGAQGGVGRFQSRECRALAGRRHGQGAPPRFHDAHRAVRGASRARLQRLRRLRAQHRRAVDSQPCAGALFRARGLSGVRRLRGGCLERLAVQHLGRVPRPRSRGSRPASCATIWRRRIATAGCRPCMRRTSATCSGSSSAPMPT